MDHPALQTLFYPFESKNLPVPQGGVLFMNGMDHPALSRFDALTIEQNFAPFVRPLQSKNYNCTPEIEMEKRFQAVLALGTKNVQETRYMIVRALEHLAADGLFMIAAANDAGGKRLAKDLKTLGLEVEEESKHKCRVVWTRKTSACADDVLREWRAKGEPQAVLDGAYISQPGLFSWDRVDKGSAMLVSALQSESLKGKGADFGCGYGFLSKNLLEQHSAIKALDYIDADYRAVKACGRNLALFEGDGEGLWHDLTVKLPQKKAYDFIVMNPPFHEGKKALPHIGQAFIGNAAGSLRPNGVLYMVANRHLPYEDILAAHFKKYTTLMEKEGFKLFKAVK